MYDVYKLHATISSSVPPHLLWRQLVRVATVDGFTCRFNDVFLHLTRCQFVPSNLDQLVVALDFEPLASESVAGMPQIRPPLRQARRDEWQVESAWPKQAGWRRTRRRWVWRRRTGRRRRSGGWWRPGLRDWQWWCGEWRPRINRRAHQQRQQQRAHCACRSFSPRRVPREPGGCS